MLGVYMSEYVFDIELFIMLLFVVCYFSNTYAIIEAESNKIWKKQRYGLFYEFYHKPFFPPPIILLDYAAKLCMMLFNLVVVNLLDEAYAVKLANYSLMRRIMRKRRVGFVYEFSTDEEEAHIIKWESYIASELISDQERENKEKIDYKLDRNSQK